MGVAEAVLFPFPVVLFASIYFLHFGFRHPFCDYLINYQSFLLSDTVGFIDRLPHTLVAAFRATLEEVSEAALILHVIDASSEDLDSQKGAVKKVLDEVGASNLPFVEVYNKIDLISSEVRHRLKERSSDAIYVSALNGEGITKLQSNLSRLLALDTKRIMVTFDNCQYSSKEIAKLYRIGRVISHVAKENSIVILSLIHI